METCKECIHFVVCDEVPTKSANDCDFFKAQSRFVELPCKLGDEIFYTIRGKIYQAIVDRIELYDEGVAIITTDGYCPDSSICYHTQEEAEKAVKEREA